MSAETPGIASDKKQNAEAPTSKTPPTIIPPFEKGGLGGVPRGPGEIIPKEPEWIHHLDIWTTAETEKKSGRGRSGGNSVSVYGIQKLRELILELAVRGKLVPQNPNDEPAGELLKRIQAEKAKLVVEGKIKKDKPLPPITDEEKPFELPQGWEWVRLGNISSAVQYGYTDSANHQSRDVLLLRITDIQDNTVNWATVPGCNISLSDYESYELKNNDLVIARTGGTIGKSYLVTGLDQKAVFASYLIRIGSLSSISSKYKKVFLGSVLYWKQLAISSMGTGQPNVNGTALKGLIFPLPPLPEQHRIVAKVDELIALCDQLETQHINAAEAHEKLVSHLLGTLTQSQSADDFSANWQRIAAHFDTLFTTEASIDALKQTLLQLAVMGKLVPQDPTDEPASELLKRIQVEKARLVAEGKVKKGKSPLTPLLPRGETGSAAAAATSINPTTITLSTPPLSNSTPNPNSTPPFEKGGPGGIQQEISEEEKPFELPRGWKWAQLADLVALVTDGDHQAPPTAESGIPFLVIGNLNTGDISLKNCRFVPEEYYEKLDWGKKPIKNDLLYTVTGSYGIAIQVNISENFCVQRHVAILKKTKSTPINYLKLFLGSEYALRYATDIATGIAQKTVPLTGLRIMPIATPPLSEQHRIVAKVDELMTLCDQLKSAITQASQLQKKLADVVVEQVIAS
ncbi:restriction endonuclease subunit S [Nitrosomonas ureae]|uniref:Type I restriction modification DNA specificity domain-containing protein n=1 Tax=Nitrosomonas ureae TaxID=44577 RepID=A0A1H9BZ50_9PROT|nr:restriction endonuclease subunit S [Nitrosomonas ureae]SEP93668.1 Type I restriction modification DNA specificity domain-containing protein [Nitrosomonas ureae]